MDKPPLPIIHRLPHIHRWSSESPVTLIIREATEAASALDEIIFELLDGQGESCLLVASADEASVNCCLKNNGVAITENFARR
ncbi:hypothetical protein [Tatumella sp. UBA2305]|uniref:hypothetical protein n=1 Tax=Tatumella sp. UBA2305 TaxID=1947647 RepID=UPI0025F64989|nr:hypothetical protein [Tatumella sp. UBA2305]